MTLPNFVIIGAQKAATTSLWRYLPQHPRIFMSPKKETDFFVAEMSWPRGLDWYESLFAGAAAPPWSARPRRTTPSIPDSPACPSAWRP